ncbi:DUF4340 domain-containing protein [Coprococcus comes]|uniref:DUF4340 domain-containing protein n=1 Tax=Coprococcus comes TaxID=410072 RepID=A0A3R6AGA5_9FIRM|nr:DUF4340 domain-containing protein [Coprococcus comes]RGU42918.1 DUF4340 domain-containing protein [Coprococcus comes]
MKKQWLTIGILCIGILILGGACFFLLKPDDPEKSDAESGNYQILDEITEDDVESVIVSNASGGYEADWNDDSVIIKDCDNIAIDNSAVKKIQNAIKGITAEKKVTDGKGRLNEFGLEDDPVEVTVTGKGEKESLMIGDEVPGQDSSQWYVLWKEEVYIVSDSNVEAFQYGVKDLVSKQITPDRDESDDSFRVTLADIQGEGMDEIQIRHQGSEELAGYQVDSYQLTAPINYPASAAVSEDILPMFFGLKAQEVAMLHPTAEDRAQVGLDQPYRQVEIEYQTKNSEKNKLSILVSNIDGAGNLYVENGSDVIYKCRPQDISWLNLTVDTVISHTILIPDVTSLKTLTITQGDGSSYQIQFQNMGTDNGKVLYDGKELDVDSFRNFYYGLISVEADEVILENLPDTSGMNKIAEIKFAYMDESKKSDTVTYYSESARKAYAVLDGNERGFRLSETQIDTVLGNLQKLINGEEIKARY